MPAIDVVLQGYTADAASLITPYEAINSAALYDPVADLLPPSPATILDIGAGTGRDAAWFARQGHRVTAVEPVHAFRKAGLALHADTDIRWLDDCLPHLQHVTGRFHMITIIGVWQHLDDDAQDIALRRIAGLLMEGGIAILPLRHGPGKPHRPVRPCDPGMTSAAAAALGLATIRQGEAESVQPSNRADGVHWTWLVLQR